MTAVPAYDAVVLAGGRAMRLGGIDKTALGPAGDTLLDRALRSVAGASRRILVAGPEVPAPRGVLRVTESPRYGGPVAALAAALRQGGEAAALVVVLAADLPAVEQALPLVLAAVDLADFGGRMDRGGSVGTGPAAARRSTGGRRSPPPCARMPDGGAERAAAPGAGRADARPRGAACRPRGRRRHPRGRRTAPASTRPRPAAS